MPREFARKLRVATELKRTLNELLISGVKDPRLEGVRVSDVEVSGDLSVARVYYATLGVDDDFDEIDRAFDKAKGFLRSRAGRALRLRRVPELRFEHDMSAERGLELTRLIERSTSSSGDDR